MWVYIDDTTHAEAHTPPHTSAHAHAYAHIHARTFLISQNDVTGLQALSSNPLKSGNSGMAYKVYIPYKATV